jgi:hypothetical protein
VEESSLAHSVFALRKALRDRPKEPIYIATIAGRGYQFVAPVAEHLSEPPLPEAFKTPRQTSCCSITSDDYDSIPHSRLVWSLLYRLTVWRFPFSSLPPSFLRQTETPQLVAIRVERFFRMLRA